MKTKKEIEQLAEQDFNDRQECGHYELADLKSIDYYYDGFTNGYTQCQQDNKDKKYTEEDIEKLCDDCCDDYIVDINNQYIGKVFQWLINNDYVICKKVGS